MTERPELANRRPLRSRGAGWAKRAAALAVRSGLSPNQISVIGVGFAALGGWAFAAAPDRPWLYAIGVAGIQLRLICNLLDGMVAIEGGRKSASGPLYNEVPDRVEDSILLVAFGAAGGLLWLGLTAALLAAITAYIRTLGGAFGLPQDFRGPMAKQQRMAALSVGAVAALVEAFAWGSAHAIAITLWVVAIGAALTAVLRTRAIARLLGAAA